MLLGQIEVLLEQLVANGGGWGVMAAMLWIGFRIWKEVKPHLKEVLELRMREVSARESQAKAQLEIDKSMQGLRTSVDGLAGTVEKVMNNGFAKITEKIVTRTDREGEN